MLKRGQRRKLKLAGMTALTIGAVGLLAWAVLWPIAVPSPSMLSQQLPDADKAVVAKDLEALDDNEWGEQLSSRRLQGWVVDSPAASVGSEAANSQAPTSVSGPLAGVQLTGTIIEPGHSYALVVDRHGVMDLKPVGGTLQLEPAGIRIDSIASRSIVVSFQGNSQELIVTKSAVVETATGAEEVRPMGDIYAEEDSPIQDDATQLEEELDSLNGTPAEEMNESLDMGVDN